MPRTEYFSAAAQPRDHLSEHHTEITQGTLARDCRQPRIIFSRLTQAKYHPILRKNSGFWQIDTTTNLFFSRPIQDPGCYWTSFA